MIPIELDYGHANERRVARYKLTSGGHFAAFRKPGATCIEVAHVHSGMLAIRLPHIGFHTLKSAIAAFNAIEVAASESLAVLAIDATDVRALRAVRAAMRTHLR